MNFLMLMFLWMIMVGVSIGSMSSNWLILWVSMELVLFGFIFFMYSFSTLSVNYSAMQYFLIQSLASILLLPMGYLIFHSLIMMNQIYEVWLMLLLILKLGAFPFHFWVIPVVYGIHLTLTIMLLGPLKVIPLIICYTLIQKSPSYMLSMVIFMSSMGSMLTGSFLGNLVNNLRSVVAASSITHTGWLMIGCMVMNVWQYFMCYYLVLVVLILAINYNNMVCSSLSFIALSGLPPFLIFYVKLIMIWSIISYNLFYGLLIVMVVSSIISLIFYLKFAFMLYLNTKKIMLTSLPTMMFFMINGVGISLFMSLFFYGGVYALDF